MAGEMLCLVEYRSTEAAIINWRNKETGRPESMPSITHTVESGNTSIKVRERVQDPNWKPEGYVSPFKKGSIVVLHLESLMREKGNVSGSGKLELLAA